MTYKVNILTRCENEEETAVVVAAALTAADVGRPLQNNLFVKNIKRAPTVSTIWSAIGRHERMQRKLNT